LAPLHCSSPFIGELRCQAIQTEHGPYILERTQKAVYIVRCLWGCDVPPTPKRSGNNWVHQKNLLTRILKRDFFLSKLTFGSTLTTHNVWLMELMKGQTALRRIISITPEGKSIQFICKTIWPEPFVVGPQHRSHWKNVRTNFQVLKETVSRDVGLFIVFFFSTKNTRESHSGYRCAISHGRKSVFSL
jgi:hypothetical protein